MIKPDAGRIVCVFDELGEVLFDLLRGERKVGHARQEQVERLRRLFLPKPNNTACTTAYDVIS